MPSVLIAQISIFKWCMPIKSLIHLILGRKEILLTAGLAVALNTSWIQTPKPSPKQHHQSSSKHTTCSNYWTTILSINLKKLDSFVQNVWRAWLNCLVGFTRSFLSEINPRISMYNFCGWWRFKTWTSYTIRVVFCQDGVLHHHNLYFRWAPLQNICSNDCKDFGGGCLVRCLSKVFLMSTESIGCVRFFFFIKLTMP